MVLRRASSPPSVVFAASARWKHRSLTSKPAKQRGIAVPVDVVVNTRRREAEIAW
jgi:hypothetical protein